MNGLIRTVFDFTLHFRCLIRDMSDVIFDINRRCPSVLLDGLISDNSQSKSTSVLEDIIGDGFLYGVPKRRRTIEKRLSRRFGYNKLLVPKNNLVMCNECGHFHPVHAVCGNCYEKIKEETQVMQKAIIEKLNLQPIDKEVIVLYQNDPKPQTLHGKQIVEIPKERPAWFSKNLLAKESGTNRTHATEVDLPQAQPSIKSEN